MLIFFRTIYLQRYTANTRLYYITPALYYEIKRTLSLLCSATTNIKTSRFKVKNFHQNFHKGKIFRNLRTNMQDYCKIFITESLTKLIQDNIIYIFQIKYILKFCRIFLPQQKNWRSWSHPKQTLCSQRTNDGNKTSDILFKNNITRWHQINYKHSLYILYKHQAKLNQWKNIMNMV